MDDSLLVACGWWLVVAGGHLYAIEHKVRMATNNP
jgi:hypothetical protein